TEPHRGLPPSRGSAPKMHQSFEAEIPEDARKSGEKPRPLQKRSRRPEDIGCDVAARLLHGAPERCRLRQVLVLIPKCIIRAVEFIGLIRECGSDAPPLRREFFVVLGEL